MARGLFSSAAIMAAAITAPLNAQDHSGHAGHAKPAAQDTETATGTAMDHCAMGHLPPDQCPPKTKADSQAQPVAPPPETATKSDTKPDRESEQKSEDHSAHQTAEPAQAQPMDHGSMDHGSMDHGAMEHGSMDHGSMDHGAMDHSGHAAAIDKSVPGAAPESAVPARAFEGPRHAADAIWGQSVMAPSRVQLAKENGGMKTGMILIERLEARFPAEGGETGFVWDAQGWYGGDINRFVVKTEGEGAFGEGLEDAEIQALFSRAIGPFWDIQAGVRFDPEPDTRGHLVLGVQGLAPYMFHVDGALFLSDTGDLTARIEAEYDQRITQQLILQPRIELEASAQDIDEREIGAGFTKIEPGLRLRYEIVPEFAPYVGIEYEAKLGRTADLARAMGDDPDGLKLLIGLRAWF